MIRRLGNSAARASAANAPRAVPAAAPAEGARGAATQRANGALEDENWVAAELGSDGSALFTEPMTIDELEGSRSMLQAAFNLAPASLGVRRAGDCASDSSDGSVESVEIDRQMQGLVARPQAQAAPPDDMLTFAFQLAKNPRVQRTLFEALQEDAELFAGLQRACAARGIDIHRAPELPPALAAPACAQAGDNAAPGHAMHDGPGAFEQLLQQLQHRLGALGATLARHVTMFLERTQERIDALARFLRGEHAPKWQRESEDGPQQSPAHAMVDGAMAVASMLVLFTLVRRIALRLP